MDKDEMKKLEKEKGELKSESPITSCDVSWVNNYSLWPITSCDVSWVNNYSLWHSILTHHILCNFFYLHPSLTPFSMFPYLHFISLSIYLSPLFSTYFFTTPLFPSSYLSLSLRSSSPIPWRSLFEPSITVSFSYYFIIFHTIEHLPFSPVRNEIQEYISSAIQKTWL